MGYSETKVYFDGSHYIAIPHTERPPSRKPKKIDIEDISPIKQSSEENKASELLPVSRNDGKLPLEVLAEKSKVQISSKVKTKRELFEKLYKRYFGMSSSKKKEQIFQDMRQFFPNDKDLEHYVQKNMDRKKRNLICRRKRMVRKAYLTKFNYFCTFTYDDRKHTELTFKKKLKKTFANFASRKSWKYMGVWERSPEKQRLHFHGLFNIPDGTIPDKLEKKRDYSTTTHRMQETIQSEYFNERFGRNDFKPVNEHEYPLGSAIQYLMKYIEKTGERIVYSKGLYQYFISDITDDDVVCPYGQEDLKLLLFDDFKCHDEGVFVGNVCDDVIALMRKSN